MVNTEKLPFLASGHPYGSYSPIPRPRMKIHSINADGLEVTAVDCGPVDITFENGCGDSFNPPQCVIFCILSGIVSAVHEGHGVEADAGTLVAAVGSAAFSFRALTASRLLVFRVPGETMDRMTTARRGIFRVVRSPHKSQAGSLLFPLLGTLATEIWNVDGELSPGLEQTVYFLGMSTAEIVCTEMRDRHPAGSVSLLIDVKETIERQLGSPGVSPAALAAEHHISVRQLHRLFESTGESVMQYIKRRRLESFARDLADADLRHRKISELAAVWGMPDAAMLSKDFRSAYGVPPREYRKTNCPD
ncbi:helix-turn-helix domain-containing protein [Streptomyces sp. NPDC048278]|uniref:helix-turn-helix domain-containing protein n=1 Tax=Streptomyces sp. NPDC048278 TaxID=3155809 RepID=UPI00344A59C6